MDKALAVFRAVIALKFPKRAQALPLSLSPNVGNPKTMLLLSPTPAQLIPPSDRRRFRSTAATKTRVPTPFRLLSMAKDTSDPDSDVGLAGKTAIAGGLVSVPVIAWSLYTLKTTGCGLPPGPGGTIGALEGVSYLAVFGIAGWSAYTKSKTGSGLPSGPFGLLGAVEGLSYLALLGIAVVFALQFFEKGYIPGPLPADQCFG